MNNQSIHVICLIRGIEPSQQRLGQSACRIFSGVDEIALVPPESRIHVRHKYLRHIGLVNNWPLITPVIVCNSTEYESDAMIRAYMEFPFLPFDDMPVNSKTGASWLNPDNWPGHFTHIFY